MRIGIDARFYGPESKGLGRYTQKLITNLEKIDVCNEYVIFLRKENYDSYTPSNPRFIRVVADYKWYGFAEQVLFPIKLLIHKCDLVHFPHFNVPVLYMKKYIVTIHDLILLRYPTHKASTRNAFLYWFKFLMYRFVISLATRRAAMIIAVSNFTKADICAQYSHACSKTEVVYEAAEVSVKKFEIEGQEVLQQYGIMEPYMLYVGNAYPHKNLPALIDAYGQYVKGGGAVQQLVLVGKDDYFYQKLQKHIAGKKNVCVTILHTVNDEVLRVLYQNAHVFVFPSLYEGFGLPPLEAQSFGVPVLSSDHACMREILSEDGALYCDVQNIDVFSCALEKIVSDEGLRRSLVSQGSRNVQRYSWRKMAQEVYNIYKKTA